jgi:ubiquitin-activating enzyme E1
MKIPISIWPFLILAKLSPFVSAKGWGVSVGINPRYHQLVSPLSKSKTQLDRIRGGGASDDDEERYSRQVYTLGARAHGMVRSATVYVDGPSESGLLYECVKNLALSGVGKIVIVTSDKQDESAYHSAKLDDLGQTYITGARAELALKDDDMTAPNEIIVEFLRRLNPSLEVDTITRDKLEGMTGESNHILLCVDRPYDTQVELNEFSRKHSMSFVAVETAGVYGRTFCDFGEKFEIHDIDGETPLVVPFDSVERIDEDEESIRVRCVSGEKHDVSKGDQIQFQLDSGEVLDATCSVVQVHSPELITIKLESSEYLVEQFISKLNAEARSFTRLKQIEEISFIPLKRAIADSKEAGNLFTPSDLDKSFDETRRNAVFSSFQALNDFVKSNERLPGVNDWKPFCNSAEKAWNAENVDVDKEWKAHCRRFMESCAAKFVPLQGIFGAVASQECLKAASGLYNPIRQFLLYDCDEVLPSSRGSEIDASLESGQAYIFGKEIVKVFQNENILVVGAGAIGCEILKNLAAMKAGTGTKGSVIVTDMDTIERSNLSRQLLFRDTDIGKFKSKAAAEAIGRLNPSLKIKSYTSKVGEEEYDGPFDDSFWSKKVDVVLNALDNVEARLFMDGQCVANEKALVDAGTLGSKGNVQVVVPNQSESYGSSADQPELAIPVCTLKNFPYQISHTIQWGRDLFDGLFVRRPKQANQYAEVLSETDLEDFGRKLQSDLGEQAAVDAAKELSQDLYSPSGTDKSLIRKESIEWAIELGNELFHDAIQQLLVQHPVDSLDEDGKPFWSGSRKTPKALLFSDEPILESQALVNHNYVDFVRYAARLRMEAFLEHPVTQGESLVTVDEVEAALRQRKSSSPTGDSQNNTTPVQLKKLLEPLSSFSGLERAQNIAEFEKDDDSNGHIAFITASSNLRAMCYGIPPVDAMETRRVAGKIVPAMITTTAFVSSLSCVELLKAVQGLPLQRYRNAFINLALPFFAFTAPLPAEEFPGLRGKTYTLWDRLIIKESKKTASKGGITVRKFMKRLKKKVCEETEAVEISTISFGQFMIYANFLNEDDDEVMDMNLWDAVQQAVETGTAFDDMFSRDSNDKPGGKGPDLAASNFMDLVVVVEDLENGDEVELPPVRVVRFKR